MNPTTAIQQMTNISLALEFLKQDGMSLLNISTSDIYEENLKIILSLVWKIVLKYEFHQESDTGIKSSLLSWLQKQCQAYPVTIVNFAKSFQSGLALSALVNSMDKEVVNMKSALSNCDDLEDQLELNMNAIYLAQTLYGIPALIEGKMVTESPDESCILLYVFQFYMKLGRPAFEEKTLDKKKYSRKSFVNPQSSENYNSFVKIFQRGSTSSGEGKPPQISPIDSGNNTPNSPGGKFFRLIQREGSNIPRSLEKCVRDPSSLIWFQKYALEDKKIETLKLFQLLHLSINSTLKKDNEYIKMFDEIENLLQNSKFQVRFPESLNSIKLKDKDYTSFNALDAPLKKFIQDKYVSFTYSPVWMDILKTHSGKKGSEVRQKNSGFNFWSAFEKHKKPTIDVEVTSSFDDAIKKHPDHLSVFKKYAEGEMFINDVNLYLLMNKFKEICLNVIKEKKITDIYDMLHAKLGELDLKHQTISSLKYVTGKHSLDIFNQVEKEITKDLNDKFIGFQNSTLWEQMLKTSNRKSSVGDKPKFEMLVDALKVTPSPKGSPHTSPRTSQPLSSIYRSSTERTSRSSTHSRTSSGDPNFAPEIPKLFEPEKVLEQNKVNYTPTGDPSRDKLFEVIVNGNFEDYEQTIKDFTEIGSIKTLDGLSLLHLAVTGKNYKICENLLEKGVDVGSVDKFHRTPLHFSCTIGNREISLMLLGNKAKVNNRDQYGTSPLGIALRRKHYEICQDLMLFGADINFKKENGNTVLHEAVLSEDLDGMRWILQQSNLKVNNKDISGYSPFLRTCAAKNPSIFFEMLKANGVDWESHDSHGRNFVHLLVLNENIDVLKSFASMSSEEIHKYSKLFVEATPLKSKTPMHIAVERKSYKLVGVLVPIYIKLHLDFGLKNSDDQTPYDLANKIGEKYVDNIGNATPEERKELESIVKIKQFLSKYSGNK